MKSKLKPKAHHLLAILLAAASAARANVTPSPLFSDHMVIQQGFAVPVFGTADPGEAVTVSLGTEKQTATAGPDGKWMVKLAIQKAAGLDAPPAELTIAGKNSITVHDVLIGEVWLGSGQSNMEFSVSAKVKAFAGLTDEAAEIAAANYPKIRMFTVRQVKSATPAATLSGTWEVCSPQTVPAFSAVGYLFARDLQKEIKQPVGIITSAFGASTAESWISREALSADPALKPMLDNFDGCLAAFKANPAVTIAQLPPGIHKPVTINGRIPAATAALGNPVPDQHQPTVLFNGMIAPIIPYAIRGALWYQGESIVGGDAGLSIFGHVTNTLVTDWRKRWGEGDFPFYIAQIPGQQNVSNNPRVREQQAELLKLPNTGIAVIMDTGEAKNVHPHNKAPLGDRLTKIALANAYDQKIEYSGPVYDSLKVESGAIRLKFTHVGAGLAAKDGDLKWFQIAGVDQKFVTATAKIDGDTIVVSSPDVKDPVAVRYGWDNWPAGMNLWNKDGLMASPFRTDTWKYPIEGIVEAP